MSASNLGQPRSAALTGDRASFYIVWHVLYGQ
jgi:hypothetical protein